MFIEPGGLFRFRIPLLWAYDPETSELARLQFTAWSRPEDSVEIHAIPTTTLAAGIREEWGQELQEALVASPRGSRLPCRGGASGVLSTREGTTRGATSQHFLVLPGARVHTVAIHTSGSSNGEDEGQSVLRELCRSIELPGNVALPEAPPMGEALGWFQEAVSAATGGQWDTVFAYAKRGVETMRSAFVQHLGLEPMWDVVHTLIGFYRLAALATGSMLPLQDATLLTERARKSLDSSPERVRAVESPRFDGVREELAGLEREWARRYPRDLSTSTALALDREWATDRMTSVPSAAIRAYWRSALLSSEWLAAGNQPARARIPAEAMTSDLLTALLCVPRLSSAEQIPSGLRGALGFSGGEGSPEPFEAVRDSLQQDIIVRLQATLPSLFRVRAQTEDKDGARDASRTCVDLGRRLKAFHDTDPERWTADYPPQVALAEALLWDTLYLLDAGDPTSLEQADKSLVEAEGLLDELDDEGILRANACHLRAKLLMAGGPLGTQELQADVLLKVIDRGLSAAAAAPSPPYEAKLKAQKAQLLGLWLNKTDEAEELWKELREMPPQLSHESRMAQGDMFLEMAQAELSLGRLSEALRQAIEALTYYLAEAPLSEPTSAAFHLAALIFRDEFPPATWYRMMTAAVAALEARHGSIAADPVRVSYDDAARRREIYEELVGGLLRVAEQLPQDEPGRATWIREAIVTADRARGRALGELMKPAESSPTTPAERPEMPRLFEAATPREALWEAADFLVHTADAELSRLGAAVPLRGPQLEQLVLGLQSAALILQPVGDRLALLVLHTDGRVDFTWSPAPTAELISLALEIHRLLHDTVVNREARTRSNMQGTEMPSPDRLWSAVARLSEGLAFPLTNLVTRGEPLIIVPYRELTLVPFHLLHDEEGNPFGQDHAISLTPSLMSVRTLRRRGLWERPRFSRAYIAGDPAVDPGLALKRLPRALVEAAALGSQLRDTGMARDEVRIVFDVEADEASYRSEAPRSDLVHLACHASVHESSNASRLYLAPDQANDGILLASEIADIRLDDALVFLAACETGRGRPTADGVIGLGRAFLMAGARAVVLSLCKVEDSATAVFSHHFYERLLTPQVRLSAAHVLQEAMIATRADLEAGRVISGLLPLESHPAFWAPFVILGDGFAIRMS